MPIYNSTSKQRAVIAGCSSVTLLASLLIAGCGSTDIHLSRVASVTPAKVVFGDTLVGAQSAMQAVTVTNPGTGSLTIRGISLGGADASSFKVVSDNCSTSLPPSGSCIVQVAFAPSSTNPVSASIVIADSAGNSPQLVPLSGAGNIDATVVPSAVIFGKTLLGTESNSQIVTLTNPGETPLAMGTVTLTGAGAASFRVVSNNCGTSLPAGGSCGIQLAFAPMSTDVASASVVIVDSAANSPQSAALSGAGNVNATIAPAAVTFGNTLVGAESSLRAVTVTNPGETPLAMGAVTLTGAGAASFRVVSNNCGSSLPGGGSCSVQVAFVPSSTNPASALLVLADNAANSPQSVPLDGVGNINATLTPAAVDFGSMLPGTQSISRVVEMANPGQTPLAIEGSSLSGSGATSFRTSSNCGTNLPAGGMCNIQVTFAPNDTGSASASLSIVDGAANSPQLIPLTGTGSADAVVDVIVYGATPAGLMVAIEAAKHGKQVLLLEPTQHIGGMMSNGLGYTDRYVGAAIGGLAKQFFNNVDSIYGSSIYSDSGQLFEPHVAEQAFQSMIGQYSNITVFFGKSVESTQMTGTTIDAVVTVDGSIYHGREFIDASYTGDLMEAANVSYTVGRESAAQYAENLGGVSKPIQLSDRPVSPYLVSRDPSSGLAPHVMPGMPGAPGSADGAVMAYNYRLCLSSDPSNQIPFAAPSNYDPAEYDLLGRVAVGSNPQLVLSDYLSIGHLPNNKIDLNSTAFGFSTDEVGGSTGYPDGTATARQQSDAEHKRYMQGLLYFLSTDSRIPLTVRNAVQALGLCKDEFTDNGGWPHQLYVREARRMLGSYVQTENDLELKTSIPDSIGVGGYSVDDHVNYLFNLNGVAYVEFGRGRTLDPYPISYRILTPQASQATNLLVPVDVSASHVAYDSLRIEVTYMIMGQAAGAAASLAIDGKATVQDVDYGALGSLLQSDGAVITPP